MILMYAEMYYYLSRLVGLASLIGIIFYARYILSHDKQTGQLTKWERRIIALLPVLGILLVLFALPMGALGIVFVVVYMASYVTTFALALIIYMLGMTRLRSASPDTKVRPWAPIAKKLVVLVIAVLLADVLSTAFYYALPKQIGQYDSSNKLRQDNEKTVKKGKSYQDYQKVSVSRPIDFEVYLPAKNGPETVSGKEFSFRDKGTQLHFEYSNTYSFTEYRSVGDEKLCETSSLVADCQLVYDEPGQQVYWQTYKEKQYVQSFRTKRGNTVVIMHVHQTTVSQDEAVGVLRSLQLTPLPENCPPTLVGLIGLFCSREDTVTELVYKKDL